MGKTCILCESPASKVIFKEFGTDILRCVKCGHIYSDFQRERDYGGYFDDVESGLSKSEFWSGLAHEKMHDDFCRRFIKDKNGGKLLDVGCGLGFFLKKVDNYPQWEYSGCDTSPVAVEFAVKKLGLRNVSCCSVEEARFELGSFDIITLWSVAEHLSEPHFLLSRVRDLLKKDGMLFVHVPNIDLMLPFARILRLLFGMKRDIYYLEARHHLHHYSMKTIRTLLEKNGFDRISFLHLPPVQSVAGNRSLALREAKNIYFLIARLLWTVSFHKVNFDQLFLTARKPG